MKSARKFLSLLSTAIIILSICSPAAAVETKQEKMSSSFEINEYALIKNLKQTPVELLKNKGYSEKEIEKVTAFSFEDALLKRAQLPESELYEIGYNAEQVYLLKSYDGGSLENNPQMEKAFFRLTGKITPVKVSKNSMSVKFEWEWENAPVFSHPIFGITDVVSCSIFATDDDGMSCAAYVNDISCRIEYYQRNGSFIETEYFPVTETNERGDKELKFKMGKFFGAKAGWAKKGMMTASAKEVVDVNRLYSITFGFKYGHTILLGEPTLGILPIPVVSPNRRTEELLNKFMSLRYDGTFDTYN